MNITPSPLTVSQLLSSTSEQYFIPAYQRRYSWTQKQVGELIDDILQIDGNDTHLLGSIVCLTGHHIAGINQLELVDGQQRLTTIYILLHCVRERLLRDGESAEAQSLESLLTSRALGGAPQQKLTLDSMDVVEFRDHLTGDASDVAGNQNLAAAFHQIRTWIAEIPVAELGTFLYRLRNQAIVIRLDVSDAKDAFKLFETINNRGLRLNSTDILKNFILGNAARFGTDKLEMARAKWGELTQHLDGVDTETFFRHFLCARLKRRLTRAYVIGKFKSLFMQSVSEASSLPDRAWYADEELVDMEDEDIDDGKIEADDEVATADRVTFEEFLNLLTVSAKTFGELLRSSTGKPEIDRHLRNLKLINAKQTYGFLMYLRVEGCPDKLFCEVLKLVEAFMLRRHICRTRSNENETAFSKLCSANASDPVAEVCQTLAEYCPEDESFLREFRTATFKAGQIDRARYILERMEHHRQGSYPELFVGGTDVVQVEHIIPQKIKTQKAIKEFGDWPEYLGDNAVSFHEKNVGRIGNLTLIAAPLNIVASNNPYEAKKSSYSESALKVCRSLPDDFPDFRFPELEARCEEMANEAVTLWPVPGK